MKNYIKKTLAIFFVGIFLSISFNGIIARAENKDVNKTETTANNNQNKLSSSGTADSQNNSTSTNGGKVNTETGNSNTNIPQTNPSNSGEIQVNDPEKIDENTNGWHQKDGKTYYFIKGEIAKNTGWFQEKDVNPQAENTGKYYLDKNYAVTIGWEKINNLWYYFDESGIMQTDWKSIDGYWYYFDNNGVMNKGWIKIGETKYYLNSEGKLVFGKQYFDDKWYFFKSDGALQTGFYTNNDKIYYSTPDGIMVTNQWITINNDKYYVNADSSVTVGEAIIDGIGEKFDSYGKYIGRVNIQDYLFIKYLNVGNADCEFIKLPNGETVLIDTGDKTTSDKVVNFLKTQNLKEENNKKVIDYVIITHGHSDHIGGLPSILNNFKVNKVYIPENAKMKDWYSNVKVTEKNAKDVEYMKTDYLVFQDAVQALKKYNMEFTSTKKDEFIDKDKILQFVQSDKDFGPIGLEVSGSYWGINNNSAVVYLNYGELKALFTGDLEWTAERDFWKSDLMKGNKMDVLKVPHHGRDTSSTSDFIEYLKPSIGIVSRAKESIEKNEAYISLTVNAVNLYETSEKDGVAIAATKDNWILQK